MPRLLPSEIVRFIDATIPSAKAQDEQPNPTGFSLNWSEAGHLRAILALLERLPEHLVTLVDDDYYPLLVAQETIRSTVDLWTSGMPKGVSLHSIPGGGVLNPVTIIRRAMRRCPDAFPSPGDKKFVFVTDDELRATLQEDNGAVERALANLEWKAATVLAGSIIEAALLWALLERENSKSGDAETSALKLNLNGAKDSLARWGLDAYVRVARDLELLSSTTETEALLAKDFRNLIHPGKAQRANQRCDRSTAFHAVAALDHVCADLRIWVSKGMP